MNLSTFLVLLVVCACGGSCGHCGSHSMCENPKAFFDQIKKEQFSK